MVCLIRIGINKVFNGTLVDSILHFQSLRLLSEDPVKFLSFFGEKLHSKRLVSPNLEIHQTLS